MHNKREHIQVLDKAKINCDIMWETRVGTHKVLDK